MADRAGEVDLDQALIEETRAFGDVVFAARMDLAVPSCPGWSITQLLRHVGRGHRWAAEIISQEADLELDPRCVPEGRPPDDPEGARTWLDDGARLVIDAANRAAPDLRVWSFLGPKPPRWWVRRRLHETTVHRADAAIATDQHYRLRTDLAVDAIDEWFDRLAVELEGRQSAIVDGKTFTVEATDSDASWTVRGTPGGIQWSLIHEPRTTDLRLRGPATGLLLALLRRQTPEQAGVHVRGDTHLWSTWLGGTPL